MPITNPRAGTFRDIKALLSYDSTGQTGYNWRANVRNNNDPVIPTVFEWSEVGNRKGVQDPCIVVQTNIIRGIETSSGLISLRARMGITMSCYSKNPKVCEKMADGIWNALFISTDRNGIKKYISAAPNGIMSTLRKIIPIGMADSPPRKEFDDQGQPTGWWVQIVRLEAETQQAN